MPIDTDRGPELAAAAANRPPNGPPDPAMVDAVQAAMLRRAQIRAMLDANRPPDVPNAEDAERR
ncbi:MAG: hypothetical protein M3Y91_09355 [Actinomycetota bacterium]|nr:hypothetical protein [Actinomycetota bacterium]